ncbi:MAG: RidA family protein [Rhodobacteraceae bacterium]|nr:RidA family protein [Paracoccaceae bacterium]
MSDTGRQVLSRPVNPAGIHPPFGNYSHGVLLEDVQRILVASGQLGISRDREIPPDVAAQAEICFESADAILFEAGLDRSCVARIAGFLTHREHMGAYMAVRDRWIAGLPFPPASTLVIVRGFTRPEFKVEVEITACQTGRLAERQLPLPKT